ncbi:MAG: anaerobic ribonucleoside-triphosphate reductase activating protein [Clostridiales bacterium]|nr:anaerobic ribonucleoside-triphosphate reductase activating protein [Clostridiales bacterium]
MQIKLAGPLQSDSIVDGEGIRTVIWTQGCSHNCKGCHNPETHDFNKGISVDVEDIKKQIMETQNQDGVTLSGGDPLYQIDASLEIAKFCQEQDLNVWCYTGFTFEQLMDMSYRNQKIKDFLNNLDVLVDGKFEENKRSLNLHFKGSENQRVLDVKKSLEKGTPVEIERYKIRKKYQSYSNFDNVCKGIYI